MLKKMKHWRESQERVLSQTLAKLSGSAERKSLLNQKRGKDSPGKSGREETSPRPEGEDSGIDKEALDGNLRHFPALSAVQPL
jgi:hypothetical protein